MFASAKVKTATMSVNFVYGLMIGFMVNEVRRIRCRAVIGLLSFNEPKLEVISGLTRCNLHQNGLGLLGSKLFLRDLLIV